MATAEEESRPETATTTTTTATTSKLTEKDIEVLEEVVLLEGNCMSASRCSVCPLRSKCLVQFLWSHSATSRMQVAMNVLSSYYILGDVHVDDVSFSLDVDRR